MVVNKTIIYVVCMSAIMATIVYSVIAFGLQPYYLSSNGFAIGFITGCYAGFLLSLFVFVCIYCILTCSTSIASIVNQLINIKKVLCIVVLFLNFVITIIVLSLYSDNLLGLILGLVIVCDVAFMLGICRILKKIRQIMEISHTPTHIPIPIPIPIIHTPIETSV
jgi:hypothetical protein